MSLKPLLSFLCGYAAFVCLPLWGDNVWRECDSPADGSLTSIAFGNGMFVAVGESIVRSTDTVQWEQASDGGNHFLHQVIFAEGRFFAVGRGLDSGEPRLLTSIGGEFWEAASLPEIPLATLRSIAHREGVWITVGDEGAILYSEDGFSWVVIPDATDEDLTAVVATDAGFTAFADGWIFESANGSDWSASPTDTGEVSQVVFAEGRFFGVYVQADPNGAAWSSLDGRTRLHFNSSAFTHIGHAAGLFVGMGDYDFWLSADLADFAEIPRSFQGGLRAVAASAEKLVVVDASGVIRASDGLWAPAVTVPPTRDRMVSFAGSRRSLDVTAIGSGTLLYQWGKDGEDLPGRNQPRLTVEEATVEDRGSYSVKISSEFGTTTSASVFLQIAVSGAVLPHFTQWWREPGALELPSADALTFGNGRFVAVTRGGGSSPTVMHSRDGLTWRSGSMPALRTITANIAFGGNQFLIGGIEPPGSNVPMIVTSPDGAAWVRAKLPEGLVGPVYSVTWGDGIYAASGYRWALWSEDGVNWETADGLDGMTMRSVAFGNGFFLGMTDSAILRSEDGQSWENYVQLATSQGRLLFAGSRWWILQREGSMLHSVDGSTWTETNSSLPAATDLISANGVFIAAEGEAHVRYSGGADWGVGEISVGANQLATGEAGSLGIADIFRLAEGNGRVVGLGSTTAHVRGAEIAPVMAVEPVLIGTRQLGAPAYTVGSSFSLVAGAAGSGDLRYEWRKGNEILPGEDDATLMIESVSSEDGGAYRVDVISSAGRARSSTVQLSVIGRSHVWPLTVETGTNADQLQSIAYGNGRIVAVNHGARADSAIVHSADGISWSGGKIPTVRINSEVVFGNGKFIVGGAIGNRVVIIHSDDGVEWRTASLPDARIPNATTEDLSVSGFIPGPIGTVAFGGGTFVASGSVGTWWSEDGINWERSAVPEMTYWGLRWIAYGNGFFLGTNGNPIYRSEDGREWHLHQTLEEWVTSVLYTGERWWVRSGGKWLQSLDGSRWLDTGIDEMINLLYVDGAFLTDRIGFYGSGDGADWGTRRSDQRTGSAFTLVEEKGRVVCVDFSTARVRNAGTPPVIAVPPTVVGPKWAGGRLELDAGAIGGAPLTYQWRKDHVNLPDQTAAQLSIENLSQDDSGDYQVQVSNPYGYVLSDPVSVEVASGPPVISQPWSDPVSVGTGLFEIGFGDGRFVAAGNAMLWHSRDGILWRGGDLSPGTSIYRVCFGDGKFVAGGREFWPTYKTVIIYSGDGAGWGDATLPPGITGGVQSVAWGNGTYVASGFSWQLWSEDGVLWQRAIGPETWIRAMAYGDGYFLGIENEGAVFKSMDGREWTLHGQAFSGRPNTVRLKFIDGRFFVSTGESLRHSADGVAWTDSGLRGTADILASNEVLIAVGSRTIRYGTPTGSHWAQTTAATAIRAVAQSNGRIVGVGAEGATVRTAEIEPYVATPSNPVDILAGETAGLSVTPIGRPPFVYSWYLDDEWVADTEEPILEIPDVSPDDEGVYRLLVTSASGSTWSDPIQLIVHVPPRIVAQPGTVFASPGETVSLVVQVSGSQPMSFTWRRRAWDLGQTAEPALVIEDVTASDAGRYRLTISNAAGEVTSDPIELRVILTYDDWAEWKLAEGEIEPGQLNPEADPSGRGVPNLLRYALHLRGVGTSGRGFRASNSKRTRNFRRGRFCYLLSSAERVPWMWPCLSSGRAILGFGAGLMMRRRTFRWRTEGTLKS